MRTLADSRITYAAEAFSQFGEVSLFELPLDPELTRDADILVLRTDLRLDADLLRLCSPTFIGCPAVGTDHVNFEYLQERGIAFAHAPGCNSDSVRDYVMAALLRLATREGRSLKELTLGVVGVGRIGLKVAAAASALGLRVLLNDPPRARQEPDFHSVSLDELMEADFLSLHVPLLLQGEDQTHHLFDRERLSKIKNGRVLINASRGAVVDGAALKAELQEGRLKAVLDVWENEPNIDYELLELVQIGTPHVGGQALEARERGTEVIFQACCRHLGVEPDWSSPEQSQSRKLVLSEARGRREEELDGLVREAYDIEADDRMLRELRQVPPRERVGQFHRLRRIYRRHELSTFSVELPAQSPLEGPCRALGFNVSQALNE